jgi:hypothetical protein
MLLLIFMHTTICGETNIKRVRNCVYKVILNNNKQQHTVFFTDYKIELIII